MSLSNPFDSSKNSTRPDEQEVQRLVLACQEGEVEAFGRLYDLYVDPIYRYVYYRIEKEDVEDLVETIFIRAWENIDKYRPSAHPFSAWLFRIAHNLVVDHYRFHRKHISLNDYLPEHLNTSQDDPKDWAGKRLSQGFVRKALGQMKDSYQQVLVLKYLMGFDNTEIAVIMQRNLANIRILQYRALKALRQILEMQGIDCND